MITEDEVGGRKEQVRRMVVVAKEQEGGVGDVSNHALNDQVFIQESQIGIDHISAWYVLCTNNTR
jgi:hypothetical protein